MLYEQGADSLVLGLIINEHGALGGGVRQPLKAGHANDVAADQIGEIGAMESGNATFGGRMALAQYRSLDPACRGIVPFLSSAD